MKIALLPGDGIGPEVMDEAVKILQAIAKKYNHSFQYTNALIGGAAWDDYGCHLPKATLDICEKSDAILFGSVGGPVEVENDPKWKDSERNAILGIRKHFDLGINLRPVKVYPFLSHLCPLKEHIIQDGVDFVIVRELVSGIYFGKHQTFDDYATDELYYNTSQIKRAIKAGFEAAQKRDKRMTLIDKANVLDTSRLWRRVCEEMKNDYPEIEVEYMYVDNATMQIIKNPSRFDVMVTSNMFGDILSDGASVLPGSLGMMPSASLGTNIHMYEPIGGSAPRRAGQNIINPCAQILSAALMLRYSFGLDKEALEIETAVTSTIQAGYRTYDLMEEGCQKVSTSEMGDIISQSLLEGGIEDIRSGEYICLEKYDQWGKLKKKVSTKQNKLYFKEKDIFFMHMGKNIGYEQDGKGDDFLRPVIIIKKFNKDMFWGIPLTTNIKQGKYYYNFDLDGYKIKRKNNAILSQIRPFGVERLNQKIGVINDNDFNNIKESLKSII